MRNPVYPTQGNIQGGQMQRPQLQRPQMQRPQIAHNQQIQPRQMPRQQLGEFVNRNNPQAPVQNNQTQRQAPRQQVTQQHFSQTSPAVYADTDWEKLSDTIAVKVMNGNLLMQIRLDSNPAQSNSGRSELLASTGGWLKLDTTLEEGCALSLTVSRRISRKRS